MLINESNAALIAANKKRIDDHYARRAQEFDLKDVKLVVLDSLTKAKSEAHHMAHALFYMMQKNMLPPGTVCYSMRDLADRPILSLSVKDGVCRHIVGYANAQPRPKELAAVTKLLAAINVVVEYDPATTM